MKNELPEIDLNEQDAEVFSKFKVFRVKGESMLPLLKNGDLVLVNPASEPQTGDIVLANHPFKKSVKLVKRIKEITADGRYFLIGDNPPESTDSRTFGTILRKEILGKVEAKLEKTSACEIHEKDEKN